MTREEAIEVYKGLINTKIKEAFEFFAPELAESEDERIRKEIIGYLTHRADVTAFVDEAKDCERWIAYFEKQKDVSKAIEAVERIDKYIDAHTANAHDMDDSNPDKKYYQGWDAALGKMSGILQDVYANENQKEQKDYNKLYEDIAKSEWFKKAYEGKSLECDYEQEEQKPADSEDERIRKWLSDILDASNWGNDWPYTKQQVINYLEKQKEHSMSAEEVLARAGLKPYKDGNQWCILAGDNIQEGICGFGDTIDEALYQFLIEVLEKQKEQKPTDNEEKFESIDNAFRRGREVGFREGAESVKPVEWSEHQHKLLNYAINVTDDREVKKFLELLRNQPVGTRLSPGVERGR